jgi:GTP-binding protein
MATRRKKKRAFRPADQRPGGTAGGRPVVAVVGRPNVGKSALFNRLAQKRIAIVEDTPGVTRDRLYADATALGRDFVLIDTGGFDPDSPDAMAQSIAAQVHLALSETDLVLCVFDGKADPTPADREAVELLRRSEKPVIYLANKSDNPRAAHDSVDLYSLGIPDLLPISALHGHGLGELDEAIAARLPPPREDATQHDPAVPRVAIVGRPNAGKSSLVNRLLGEQRQLVDDRPGTTVDSVDTLLESPDGDRFVLIDTAGIRRKRSVARGVESLGVLHAIRAIERSGVALLIIDAEQGPAEQDTKIAGLAIDNGSALLVALNKTDLLDAARLGSVEQQTRETLSFAPWAPIHRISALHGRGIAPLLRSITECDRARSHRVATGELNRFFDEVLAHHPPPTSGGRVVRLYFVTQPSVRPPTFVVKTNHPDRVHFSYRRYVQNQLRQRFGFRGTPLRVFYRPRSRKDAR